MPDPVLDATGKQIVVGAKVVTAGLAGRLKEREVKRLDRKETPKGWVNVWFTDGGWTTPDRVAVLDG